MKKILARALCATAIATFSTTSLAAPIYFDFVATISATMGSYSNRGLEGTIVMGGFSFETDNLTQIADPGFSSMVYDDRNPTGSYAHLNFGGSNAAFPNFSEDNELSMSFRDFCDGDLCSEPYYVDAIELYAGSSTLPFEIWSAPGFAGSFQKSTLTFTAIGDDFLDWEQAAPTDLVSLTLPTSYKGFPALSGGYSERTFVCTDGSFCSIPVDSGFGFNIESITRSVGSHSVTEPGTLGLMAFALASLWLVRRRAPAR